jgi:Zn-dependent protease with chaperone function
MQTNDATFWQGRAGAGRGCLRLLRHGESSVVNGELLKPGVAELESLVKHFALRMGAKRIPKTQVMPGSRCSYSPLHHLITVGADVLAMASPATTEAIIAHEVAHSVQPGVKLERIRRLTVLPGLGIQVLGALLLLCGLPCCFGVSTLLGFALLWWSLTPPKDSFHTYLSRELDADLRAATLLGPARMASALEEYGQLFGPAQRTRAARIRLNRLHYLSK